MPIVYSDCKIVERMTEDVKVKTVETPIEKIVFGTVAVKHKENAFVSYAKKLGLEKRRNYPFP
jgi:hypothetical protein